MSTPNPDNCFEYIIRDADSYGTVLSVYQASGHQCPLFVFSPGPGRLPAGKGEITAN